MFSRCLVLGCDAPGVPDDLGNVMMALLETSSYSVKVGDRAGAISVQRASTGEDIREQLRNRRIQIQAAKA